MVRMILIGVWLVLLDGIFFVPWWWPSANPGDWLIRYTVRLAILYYGLAALLMLLGDQWGVPGKGAWLARWAWTLAWLAYGVHVLLAIKYAHHWSHAAAVRHTQERSGFGEGIYVSHVFTLVWTFDVLWWWMNPEGRVQRSPWVARVLHTFMAFIIFCGMVVYETGFSRWAGVVLFIILGAALGYRLVSRRRRPGQATQEV